MKLNTRQVSSLALVLVPFATSACVQVQPRPDFDNARALVAQSTGRTEVYDPYIAFLSDEDLESMLADGLTLEDTLRLALVNNRDLQAQFQEIGVAHADWVQSGLLSNPSLDAFLWFPTEGGGSLLEAALGFELLELWRVPIETEEARANLEATVLRVARSAGEQLTSARNAYYAAVAAEELHAIAQEHVELVSRSYEATQRLHEAGAADALDRNLAKGPLLAAQLALRSTRVEAAIAKRDLAKRLSIDGAFDQVKLVDPLPEPATVEFDPLDLVKQAMHARLDLRAIEAAMETWEARVLLEERRAWGDVTAGAVYQQGESFGGSDLVGPSLGLTLPVFDQNQAQVARASFKLEQWTLLREAAHVAVAQDVRSGADRANSAARDLLFFEEELLPHAKSSLAMALDSYVAGRTTLLAVIEMQRQLLDARRGLVALQLEAAASTSELERLVGRPLFAQ